MTPQTEGPLQTILECALAFFGAGVMVFLPAGFLIHAVLRNVELTLLIALPLTAVAGVIAAAIRPLRKRIATSIAF